MVLCRDCGYVATCPDCTRPLVYHQAGQTLRCHHCGRARPMPTRCPQCGSARIRYLGGGTERLEREVKERFPGLRVGRLDRDVVERKGAAERVVDDFADGRLDVLVGTSLVTKGLDIPAVTLVGVVSADVALNLPDERAAERTYQLLAQAVGRAGRGDRQGRAIIQTYQPDHPAIVAVAQGRAAAFYDAELDLRRRFGSPPFGRLVKLTVALPDRAEAEQAGRRWRTAPRARAAAGRASVQVSGPAPAFVAKRGDRWRYNVVLRGDDPVRLFDETVARPGRRGRSTSIRNHCSDAFLTPGSLPKVGIGRRIDTTPAPHSGAVSARGDLHDRQHNGDWPRDGFRRRRQLRLDRAGGPAERRGEQAREWLAQLQAMIENLATQAAPVVREVGIKAAELAAKAGEKAGPVAQRAAELTGQAGHKLAERVDRPRRRAPARRRGGEGRDRGDRDRGDD